MPVSRVPHFFRAPTNCQPAGRQRKPHTPASSLRICTAIFLAHLLLGYYKNTDYVSICYKFATYQFRIWHYVHCILDWNMKNAWSLIFRDNSFFSILNQNRSEWLKLFLYRKSMARCWSPKYCHSSVNTKMGISYLIIHCRCNPAHKASCIFIHIAALAREIYIMQTGSAIFVPIRCCCW